MEYPVIVAIVPSQMPPKAWAIESHDGLITLAWRLAGDDMEVDRDMTDDELIEVIGHDAYGCGVYTREDWAAGVNTNQHQGPKLKRVVDEEAEFLGWTDETD